jgi:thiamine biosynthesis lipoprotein
MVEDFDQRFSRFRADSEVSRFNQRAGSRQEVSSDFVDLLTASLRAAERSGSTLNPLILPSLQRFGYVESFHPSPDKQHDDAFTDRHIHDVSEILIEDHTVSIPAAAALDLAGIAKGFLGDRLATWLQTQQLVGFWVALGGDVVAKGSGQDNLQWCVEIESALTPDQTIARVASRMGETLCVATSGVLKRRGVHNGKAWHHLIDPQTGKPAETDVLSASVVAADLETADAAASCIVIAGSDRMKDVLTRFEIEDVLLQIRRSDGSHDVLCHGARFESSESQTADGERHA